MQRAFCALRFVIRPEEHFVSNCLLEHTSFSWIKKMEMKGRIECSPPQIRCYDSNVVLLSNAAAIAAPLQRLRSCYHLITFIGSALYKLRALHIKCIGWLNEWLQ